MIKLVVLGQLLEVSLRMVTNGALLGSLGAFVDVAAVGALPEDLAVLFKYTAVFHVGLQSQIAFFVFLFDLANHFEQNGDLFKAFFTGLLGHVGVHIGPFIVFAVCSFN